MDSCWDEAAAAAAIERWGTLGEDVALRLYSARLLGADPALVLHGGGNVSLKRAGATLLGEPVDAILVKGSGRDLAALEPADLPALELEPLRALRALRALSDADMVNEIRRRLFDAAAPTPSIETLVHAFLPHRYIDHTHADAVLALTNGPGGAERVRAAVGEGIPILPYVRPGFELACALADAHDAAPDADAFVLVHHGLVTVGEEARGCYERHIEVVGACERFIRERTGAGSVPVAYTPPAPAAELAALAAPMLRGLLAVPTGDEDRPYRAPVLEWRAGEALLELLHSGEAAEIARGGAITTDHLIRTGTHALFVPEPAWSDPARLEEQLQNAVGGYREQLRDDLDRFAAALAGDDERRAAALGADPSPRVVLLPGAGALCAGSTARDARIAADITEHALEVRRTAHLLGGYAALPATHLFEMEFRGLQRAKITAEERPLSGRIVAVSGGAGAIGEAVAEVCVEAGAHVALMDRDREGLDGALERLSAKFGEGRVVGIEMDVTDEASVAAGFSRLCLAFGGVDVLVPNAGIAHVAPIEDLDLADFRRVLDVNLVGYLLFMREGIRILKAQGIGGNIVMNASKNVFAPGKDFGAYSASKAAGHQLGKVAALELAEAGIRVNMINADAVFGREENPSGLWAEVGPGRARSRGLKLGDLPEFYRDRNLLGVRVRGRHVGNAVVFFASNATPTTGATLPVDGGLRDAFPR